MFNARRLTMKQFAFSAFFVAAALAGGLHNATGQAINATVQTASPRVAAYSQRASEAAKPVATAGNCAASRSSASRFEPSKVQRESASHNRAARDQSAAELFADRAEFESCFRCIERAAEHTGTTGNYILIQRRDKLNCARWRQCINDAALLTAKETFWIRPRVKVKCTH